MQLVAFVTTGLVGFCITKRCISQENEKLEKQTKVLQNLTNSLSTKVQKLGAAFLKSKSMQDRWTMANSYPEVLARRNNELHRIALENSTNLNVIRVNKGVNKGVDKRSIHPKSSTLSWREFVPTLKQYKKMSLPQDREDSCNPETYSYEYLQALQKRVDSITATTRKTTDLIKELGINKSEEGENNG